MPHDVEDIIIRKARLDDINDLCDFYMELSPKIRKFFHPFNFRKPSFMMVLLAMIISGRLLTFINRVIPKLGFILLIAVDKDNSQIYGFAFLHTMGKSDGVLIANRGIVTKDDHVGKGIGTMMDMEIIRYAKQAGIKKFRVTVVESNLPSLKLHQKIGYRVMGYTNDDYWEGEYMKNLRLEMDL